MPYINFQSQVYIYRIKSSILRCIRNNFKEHDVMRMQRSAKIQGMLFDRQTADLHQRRTQLIEIPRNLPHR